MRIGRNARWPPELRSAQENVCVSKYTRKRSAEVGDLTNNQETRRRQCESQGSRKRARASCLSGLSRGEQGK